MISLFWEEFRNLRGSPCRLLECGSRRQQGQPPGEGARAADLRPDAVRVGLDAEPGEGVDFVCDLHDLQPLILAGGNFDAVLICSTLEHVRRPWVVAKELARVTRPGAVLYCATHQTFPLHDYPHDYFRFSDDALREVFAPDAGWQVIGAGMEFPCKIIPTTNALAHARDWNFLADGMLGAWILCRRA